MVLSRPRQKGRPFNADIDTVLVMPCVETGGLICFPMLAPAVGSPTRFAFLVSHVSLERCAFFCIHARVYLCYGKL